MTGAVPLFMSAEHVALMNELLAASAEVAAECARLDADYAIAYELDDGTGGLVHWVLRFDRAAGASFSLQPPGRADLTYRTTLVDELRRVRSGRGGGPPAESPPEPDFVGDPTVRDRVADAFAACRRVARVDVRLPD